ncbi:MAG: DUF6671 family protein [Bacteroidia bacterium]|jgi:hypothetical protein
MTGFENRTLLIATQHGKEKVIAPLMEQSFSLSCITPAHFNSDAFGTFSGEVERGADALEAARLKGREAARLSNAELVLSSEGSFGPHPQLFFVPFNQELLLLQDFSRNLEIWVTQNSSDTNYAGTFIENEEGLLKFAHNIGFPQHALILKDQHYEFKSCYKGLMQEHALLEAYRNIKANFGSVYAETDMRAMNNPKRMAVIEQACELLIKRMLNNCKVCNLPGFGKVMYVPGLRCIHCNTPTHLPLKRILSCPHCRFSIEEQIVTESGADPGSCSVCNP